MRSVPLSVCASACLRAGRPPGDGSRISVSPRPSVILSVSLSCVAQIGYPETVVFADGAPARWFGPLDGRLVAR